MEIIKRLRDFGFNTDKQTYIIAEIGLNHGGNVEKGKMLIDSAAQSGADAVKFQTYLTEKRAPKRNRGVFEILKKLELPFDAFAEFKTHAEAAGVAFFSTVFDDESLKYLEGIGCSMYKVASFDVANKELLRAIARTGKPVVMSVGMAEREEILNAYGILREGTDRIAILHCISSYPLVEDQAALSNIPWLKNEYDCVIGYSDHTPGIEVPLYAVAAGAQIIEKHYRIDEAFECIDAPVSITEVQMAELVAQTRRLERILGTVKMGVSMTEQSSTIFRRYSE